MRLQYSNFNPIKHSLVQAQPGQRVFFCGDVHGDKKALDHELSKVNFVEGEDMLILTGDIIDRGDFSFELVEFVCKTNHVFSIIGNHEQMFLHGLEDELARMMHVQPNNGGSWTEQYDEEQLQALGKMILENMPVALTVEFEGKRIGVTHACAPDDWNEVYYADSDLQDEMLWSRIQFNMTKTGKDHVCKGIDAVVHGHVTDFKTVSGNHIWIDTLFHTGSLTLVSAKDVLDSSVVSGLPF